MGRPDCTCKGPAKPTGEGLPKDMRPLSERLSFVSIQPLDCGWVHMTNKLSTHWNPGACLGLLLWVTCVGLKAAAAQRQVPV